MHSVVCIKQVPDSTQIRVHPTTHTIMRQGVPAIINPYDLYALEEALRLKDVHGGTITLLCMGPPQAEAALRKALSFGADDAVLVSDRAFAGSDTLATSYALAASIRRIHAERPVDLVFAGKQTIDGDTGQVGPGIAKRLGMQLLTYVAKIESLDATSRRIRVRRRSEGGVQVLETSLPCLVTVLEGINEMRFATLEDMFRAARYRLQIWDRAGAGIDDLAKIGLKGSPTKVAKVFAPQPRARQAERISAPEGEPEFSPEALSEALLARLFSEYPALSKDIVRQSHEESAHA